MGTPPHAGTAATAARTGAGRASRTGWRQRLEVLLGELQAGAAAGAGAGSLLQFVEVRAAAVHLSGDVAVGDPVAQADDHREGMLMQIVPI